MFNALSELALFEEFAHTKFPVAGECPNSPFRNGAHRVGNIPLESALDGGLPGDHAQEICLHCGRRFKKWFIPINQPSQIKVPE